MLYKRLFIDGVASARIVVRGDPPVSAAMDRILPVHFDPRLDDYADIFLPPAVCIDPFCSYLASREVVKVYRLDSVSICIRFAVLGSEPALGIHTRFFADGGKVVDTLRSFVRAAAHAWRDATLYIEGTSIDYVVRYRIDRAAKVLLDTPFGRVIVELPRSAEKLYRTVLKTFAEIERVSSYPTTSHFQ
mgnify:CR=1 FL=1